MDMEGRHGISFRVRKLDAAGPRRRLPRARKEVGHGDTMQTRSLAPGAGERQILHRVRALGLLLAQGRAVGVCVIGALQDPRREVMVLRAAVVMVGRAAHH